MKPEEIHAALAARFGEAVGPLVQPKAGDPFCTVPAASLVEVCRFLEREAAFDSLMNLSGVDWPKRNQIEIVYHLFSYAQRHVFVLKVQLDREKPEVPTLEGVWSAANWLEREQYDLLGVTFTGHSDLRRILLPDDWKGYPLRKDYKEEASWHNISTTRESPLDGFVRLDDLKKKAAAAAKETLQ